MNAVCSIFKKRLKFVFYFIGSLNGSSSSISSAPPGAPTSGSTYSNNNTLVVSNAPPPPPPPPSKIKFSSFNFSSIFFVNRFYPTTSTTWTGMFILVIGSLF